MAALLWRKRYEIVGLTKHRDHTRARVSVHDSCQVQHKEDVFAIHEGMEERVPPTGQLVDLCSLTGGTSF
jgi:hypothetical protein